MAELAGLGYRKAPPSAKLSGQSQKFAISDWRRIDGLLGYWSVLTPSGL